MRFAESARLHQNLLVHKARENSTFEVRYSAGGLPDQVIFTVQDLDEDGKPEGPQHVAAFWIVTSSSLAAVTQARVDAYEFGLDQLFLIHAQTDLVEVWEKQVTKYGSYDYVIYRWTQYSGSHVELELGHWASNLYDLCDGIETIEEEFRVMPTDPSLPITPNMAEDRK